MQAHADGFLISIRKVVFLMPTINMAATGANIKALIKARGLKVADIQNGCGFNTHGFDSHRSSFSFAGQGHIVHDGRSPFSSEMPRHVVRDAREIALDDTLCFDITCSNPLMVSPPFRGSNPYPCGSLTSRILHIYCMTAPGLCQPRGYEKIRRRAPGFSR